MKSLLAQRFRSWSILALLVGAWHLGARAESVPVQHVGGTIHGFLELRSGQGRILASGDLVLFTGGDQVTSRLVFHFKDGSIDDETTIFSQRRNFRLISDHHIQKGPSFPHPLDLLIDSQSGNVTVRSIEKDGHEEAKTNHLYLPPDLANGMLPFIIENIPPNTPDPKISMLVASPEPRLVQLAISYRGEEPFLLAGTSRKATHYEIKIEIGGVAGIVAPLVGKQPPNIQIWTVGGQAPTFVREQGPLYPDGPILTIELASPVWPDLARSGD
jgi:hypothetical protein